MKICGLQKTTLLDYPGHVAATIFTGGCNFRCPFCHNSELLGGDAEEAYSEEEILTFLKKRHGILEGVCVTGGEPTLWPDLPDFLQKLRDLGYLIKLDTNGSNPQMLSALIAAGLVDYVAMDIKSSLPRYHQVAGAAALDLDAIQKSTALLLNGKIPYEFRTTVVAELHEDTDFEAIGHWLSGCRAYYLQCYLDSDQVLTPGFTAPSTTDLLRYADILRQTMPLVKIRGVDLDE